MNKKLKNNVFVKQVKVANRAYSRTQKGGNAIFDFLFNFIFPIFFLTKYKYICKYLDFDGIIIHFSWGTETYQAATNGLLLALLFPTIKFTVDLIFHHRTNIVSILGFIGIIITGVVGVFQLSSQWIAIKDASIPLILAVGIFSSISMKKPLLYRIVCNRQVMDIDTVKESLQKLGNEKKFNELFRSTTILISLTFVMSAILHYFLATNVLVDPMPTNEQLGELMYLKYPYCVLPYGTFLILIIIRLFNKLTRLTDMTMDEIFPTDIDNN